MAIAPSKQYYNPDGSIFVPQNISTLGGGAAYTSGEELGLEPVLNYYDPQNVGFFSKEANQTMFGDPVYTYKWNPSKYDFSDLTLTSAANAGIGSADRAIYRNEDGIRIDYRPSTDTFYNSYDPNQLRDFKKNNINAYNTILADNITNDIYDNYVSNSNRFNQPLYDKLESIKEKTPNAYYTSKINLLSRQAGWQHGQNTFEQGQQFIKEIENLVPEAIKVGIAPEQINSLYSSGFSESSSANQNKIANEAANPRFSLSELVRGVAPVALLAVGGPLISAYGAGAGAAVGGAEAAAAGGTAAGGAATAGAGTGLTGGAGASGGLLASGGTVGSLSGAGSAAGIAGTQAAAGLGITAGSALPALGMATGAAPSTVGSLSAALPAPGSVGGAGLGMSAELAPGTILGSGLPGGGAIGASYALGANGLPATGLLGQPIPASSVGFGSIPETVTSGLSITPKNALDAARLAKGLIGGAEQPAAQQQQGATSKPQSIMPRGQVDYSGIINLLQARSPQRNPYSLLG
jgi:hypothetical protein